MYADTSSCNYVALVPVTNWETPDLTLAGYCYAMRHGIKIQIVTPYRVSHLQRYGVTERGNVTRCVVIHIHYNRLSTQN
jgi:hypothetical protein